MARIKIIAIGSGGNNALNRLLENNLKNVDYIAADADMESLDRSKSEIKILLGKGITDGKGSDLNLAIGKKAALESYDEISSSLKGAEIVILLAGLGGGSGTGGAPVVAALAKEMGAEVVALVSIPFVFEGNRRHEQAMKGLESLKEGVNSIIIVPNQRILEILGSNSTLIQVFNESDRLMSLIADCAFGHYFPTIFDDHDKSKLLVGEIVGFGFGSAAGEKRAVMAMNKALKSPTLTRHAIESSNGILVNFTGSGDMKLTEVNEVMIAINDLASIMDNIHFAMRYDEKKEDRICITIVLFN